MLRKIQKNEVRQVALEMAECFSDYPLYDVFFPDSKNKQKQVFYFFWYRVYTRMNFTYLTENGELLISYQKPGDKPVSPIGLIINPVFLFGFLRYIPYSALKLVREYSQMETEQQKLYYDPEKDWYFQVVCVLKKARSSGIFMREAKQQLKNEAPFYCETHTRQNAYLYRLLGMKICAEIPWRGVTHYVMRRDVSHEKQEK